MDIFPNLVCSRYSIIFKKVFSDTELEKDYESSAVRITDNEQNSYYTDIIAENWVKSNSFDYGRRFFNVADAVSLHKSIMLAEVVSLVPKCNKEKLSLQRVIQILKRHRGIMFNGDEDKSISTITTVLASGAYNKKISIINALTSVIINMRSYTESHYGSNIGRTVKWILNPVNPEEDLADKWVGHSQREKNFYRWLNQVKQDIRTTIQQRGLHNTSESIEKPFGEEIVAKIFSTLGRKSFNLRENGVLKMATGTRTFDTVGSVTAVAHNFHGND